MIILRRNEYRLSNLDEIEDVQVALEKLTHDLHGDDLKKIVSFNHTYLVITRRVKNEILKGSFDDPEFMHKFDTVFAHYYFSALKGHLRSERIPKAWDMAFKASKTKRMSNFVIMALGVNAHVNNDIAQVLFECNATKNNYKDYIHVNKIIAASMDEVIDSICNDKKLLGPDTFYLRPIFKLFMKFLIVRWRYTAWQNYLRLNMDHSYVSSIESTAVTKAEVLRRLPM